MSTPSKDRDWVDIADVLLKALSGILIPVAIFIMGFVIAEQQRASDQIRQNANQIARLFDHLASQNARKRLLAIEFMTHMTKDEAARYPRDLIVALINVAQTDENSQVALAASTALGATTQTRKDLAPLIERSLEAIPPRVYIHIRDESQRPNAARVGDVLEEAGYVVPGVERLVNVGPTSTQLRFVHASEHGEAERIQRLLGERGIDAQLLDLSPRYENSQSVRPRHYELWFAPGAVKAP